MATWTIYPNPIDATCDLQHDTGGWTVTAEPTTDSAGHAAQIFEIPDGTPDENGATLTITAPGYATLVQHGVLVLRASATYVKMDVFHLTKTSTAPRIVANGAFFATEDPT